MRITVITAQITVAALLVAWPGAAAAEWAVLTESAARTAATVEFSADGSALVCRNPAAGAASVPVRSVVALLQRSAAPLPTARAGTRRFYAEMPSGERVLAESMTFADGKLRIRNSRWGEVLFGTQTVCRLRTGDCRMPALPGDFKGVRYRNGDTVPGAIASIVQETIFVDMDGIGRIPVQGFSNVADVVFTTNSTARPERQQTEVFLQTGEILCGKITAGSAKHLALKTAWMDRPLNVPIETIRGLLFTSGGVTPDPRAGNAGPPLVGAPSVRPPASGGPTNLHRVAAPSPERILLSDLTPKSVAQTPFLDFQRPWQRDRTLLGGPLSIGDFTGAHGLALHTKTVMEFALPPAPDGAVLVGWAGIDGAIPPANTFADLRLAVDGAPVKALQLRPSGGLTPLQIALPTNASTLTITTDYGDLGSAGDHVSIIYPCLTRRAHAR
jgi:hypothetical protein